MIQNEKTKLILKIVIPLLVAVISIFVLTKYATSTSTYINEKTIASLDQKKTTVMELTAASTAASAAITLLPGDAITPIANKLADLSSYFLIVLCALYLEKYLVTITGYVTFMFLIPAACLLFLGNLHWKSSSVLGLIKKLTFVGLAIVFIIPASVKVSDLVEHTYKSSIETTIDNAKETTEEITSAVDGNEDKDTDKNKNNENEGILSELLSKVKGSVTDFTEKMENTLNHFLEALAVMIVTSCLIPIAVLLFFVWLIKMVVGTDFQVWGKENKFLGKRD